MDRAPAARRAGAGGAEPPGVEGGRAGARARPWRTRSPIRRTAGAARIHPGPHPEPRSRTRPALPGAAAPGARSAGAGAGRDALRRAGRGAGRCGGRPGSRVSCTSAPGTRSATRRASSPATRCPYGDALRMINSCVSPVDLLSDLPALDPAPVTGERGQASVEFVALVSLCCLAFGALLALRGGFDGRDAGGFLARHLVCAVTGRCDRDEARLVAAYGERDAASVRALAPNLVYEPGERELPVDWRECRRVSCSRRPGRPRAGRPRAGHGPAAAPPPSPTSSAAAAGSTSSTGSTTPTRTPRSAGSDRMWAQPAGLASRPAIPASTATTGRARSSGWIRTAAPGSAPARTGTSRAASGRSAAASGRGTPAGCGSRAAATPATCRSSASRAGWRPGSAAGARRYGRRRPGRG